MWVRRGEQALRHPGTPSHPRTPTNTSALQKPVLLINMQHVTHKVWKCLSFKR
jgi:hypothetical protein